MIDAVAPFESQRFCLEMRGIAREIRRRREDKGQKDRMKRKNEEKERKKE